MPGVTYQRQVTFTPRGPVVLNVVLGPRPGGLYALKPVLSNSALIGRAEGDGQDKAISSSATAVGVDGDLHARHRDPERGADARRRPRQPAGREALEHRDRRRRLAPRRPDRLQRLLEGLGPAARGLLNQPATTQGVTTLYTSASADDSGRESVGARGNALAVPGERAELRPRRDRDRHLTGRRVAIPRGGGVFVARGAQTTYSARRRPSAARSRCA